jgi:hypothetical protein
VLELKGTAMYQSMVGALHWIVTIGFLDITIAVMTMSVSKLQQEFVILID